MLSEYRYKRRVQFYETDVAGIVHFSWFYRYMEEAEHAMWREAGLSIAPEGSEYGWPRVSASCDFHSPLRFEDEFEVWIRIAALADKSIRYTCVMTRGAVKLATGSMTSVCVSKRPDQPMKATSIPADVTSRFKIYSQED